MKSHFDVKYHGAHIIGRLHTGIVVNGPSTIERNGEHGMQLMLNPRLLTSGEVSINDNGWLDVVCEELVLDA